MKKIAAVLLALLLALSAAACGESETTARGSFCTWYFSDERASRYIGTWYISGDPTLERITFFENGAWELRNPTADGELGLIIAEGIFSIDDDGSAVLRETTEGGLVGSVATGASDDELILSLSDDFSWLLSDYDTLSFLRETVPVLMGGRQYTGMPSLETVNDDDGGYYYSYKTQDALTTIINRCSAGALDAGEDVESSVAQYAAALCGSEIDDFTCENDEALSEKLGYSVYRVSFTAGQDEESVQWDMIVFSTDTHTYAYAYATDAVAAEEKAGLFEDDITGLYLE